MRDLLKFFVLTFVVTWTCFFAVAAILHRTPSAAPHPALLQEALVLLGTFAPGLVALWITLRTEGSAGAGALLRRMFDWRFSAKWYAFAVAYMAVIKLAAAMAHRLFTGSWPAFSKELPIVIIVAIFISTPAQSGEEIGWRGYALPRMAARIGYGPASVVLGLIWGLWHLPLFFLPGADKYGQSLPTYVLAITALSVAIAWLYVHTRGSLLMAMLMHSAVNQTIGIVPDASAKAGNPFTVSPSLAFLLTVGFLWLAAAYFLIRMPRAEMRLSRPRTA